jgi:hypothetical protein
MADAQRQLVVRTFATANGDVERTAKMLGMGADQVRSQLLTLLEGEDGRAAAAARRPAPGAAAPAGDTAPRAKLAKKK